MEFQTADLCDRFAAELQIAEPVLRDYGGSMRRAVLAQQAIDNGWSGVVVYGCIRDAFAIAKLPLGVNFRQGDWRYADEDGLIVAPRALT
ncbi:MAG TPA: hypothetical protein VH814_08040 [Steroidobacteraceae bacterium]